MWLENQKYSLSSTRNRITTVSYTHLDVYKRQNLLRVKEVIVAINKMDLVDYSEEVFNKIKADFQELNAKSTFKEQKVSYIPLSAINGGNVVSKSKDMPWYHGQTVLEYLEDLEPADVYDQGQARFPVQTVIQMCIRDSYYRLDFRGSSCCSNCRFFSE